MEHKKGKSGDHTAPPQTPRPVITFDAARYEHFLEEMGLSEDQKGAMLEALWSIIVGFVDLGFGVHPAQQACGQNGGEEPDDAHGVRNEVYSNHSTHIIEGDAVVLCAAEETDS